MHVCKQSFGVLAAASENSSSPIALGLRFSFPCPDRFHCTKLASEYIAQLCMYKLAASMSFSGPPESLAVILSDRSNRHGVNSHISPHLFIYYFIR